MSAIHFAHPVPRPHGLLRGRKIHTGDGGMMMKKRFSEEAIIGFLREAERGVVTSSTIYPCPGEPTVAHASVQADACIHY